MSKLLNIACLVLVISAAFVAPLVQSQPAPPLPANSATPSSALEVEIQHDKAASPNLRIPQSAFSSNLAMCGTVKRIRFSGQDKDFHGDHAMLHSAISGSRKIKLIDPKCLGNGVIRAAGISLETDTTTFTTDCKLPGNRSKGSCSKD